jgi:hypothetical protein
MDLVSHAGASAAGEVLPTLDCVDIPTSWVERPAVLGKSCHGVVQALTAIEEPLPVPRRVSIPTTGASSSMPICGPSARTGRPAGAVHPLAPV